MLKAVQFYSWLLKQRLKLNPVWLLFSKKRKQLKRNSFKSCLEKSQNERSAYMNSSCCHSHSSQQAQGHFLHGFGSENKNRRCGKVLAAGLKASRRFHGEGSACIAALRRWRHARQACESMRTKPGVTAGGVTPCCRTEPRKRPGEENKRSSISSVATKRLTGSLLAQTTCDSFNSLTL